MVPIAVGVIHAIVSRPSPGRSWLSRPPCPHLIVGNIPRKARGRVPASPAPGGSIAAAAACSVQVVRTGAIPWIAGNRLGNDARTYLIVAQMTLRDRVNRERAQQHRSCCQPCLFHAPPRCGTGLIVRRCPGSICHLGAGSLTGIDAPNRRPQSLLVLAALAVGKISISRSRADSGGISALAPCGWKAGLPRPAVGDGQINGSDGSGIDR